MNVLTMSFTTFLKFCAASEKGRIGIVRKFLEKNSYDFYKIPKMLVPKLIRGERTIKEAKERVEEIKPKTERRHCRTVLAKFGDWLIEQNLQLEWQQPPRGKYTAESGLVVVRLEPELGFRLTDGSERALYLWNTEKPELSDELAGEGLCLLARELKAENKKLKLGILNVRKKRTCYESLITPNSALQLSRDILAMENVWKGVQP